MNKIKVSSLLLALMLVFALVGCGGSEEVSIEGSWELSGFVDADGNEYTVADFAESMGATADTLEITYDFTAEGDMTMTMAGMEFAGTYEFDGASVSMTFEGQTSESEYDADADAIVTTDPATGMTSIITRQ